jgi:uncharacterized membrane protein
MEWGFPLLLQVATGIGLAACAGLRAFLPLFVAGLAGRLGWVELHGPFEWLASWPALVIFGVAVVTEILSDKIPLLDNLLDLLQGIVKPAAGAVLAAAVLIDLTPLQAVVVGLIVGGGTAGAVHLTKAKLRLFSSAATAGLGNPILSVGEDAASGIGALLAILIPFVLLAVVVLSLLLLIVAAGRFKRRARHIRDI